MIASFNGFPVEIWGTVSDWVMVFVTGITGFLIWRTLLTQNSVQHLQKRLTEIELNRHRIELMPKFSISANNVNLKLISKKYMLEKTLVTVSLNEFKAYNVSINPTYDLKEWSITPDVYNSEIQSPMTNIIFWVTFENSKFHVDGSPMFYVSSVDFPVFYEDEFGNRYAQELHFTLLRESHNATIKPPQLVK